MSAAMVDREKCRITRRQFLISNSNLSLHDLIRAEMRGKVNFGDEVIAKLCV